MRREPVLPSFANHLLRETPPGPPPKTAERLTLETFAKELGVVTTQEGRERESAYILQDCRQAVRKLTEERDEHKRVTESIDVLIKRYVPFREFFKAMSMCGPPFHWRG